MTEQRCDFCGATGESFASLTVPEGWSASMDEAPKPAKKKRDDDFGSFVFSFGGTMREVNSLDACLSCVRRLLILREQFKAAQKQLIGED